MTSTANVDRPGAHRPGAAGPADPKGGEPVTTNPPDTTPEPGSSSGDSGRHWAYAGIILGGLVSIAANVAHSFVPPTGAPTTWRPHTGAVVGAIVWPVFLFIAIEILARTTWPTGRRWWLLRFGGLLPVAAVAAVVSYKHLSGLLAFYGEDRLVVTIGPAAVDGLMAMATGALVAATRRTPAPPAQRPDRVDQDLTPVDPAVSDTQPASAPPLAVPTHLLPTARFAVTNHHSTTGKAITADELATRLSITHEMAAQLLILLDEPEPVGLVSGVANGTLVGAR